jgi:hypothetical protein
LSTWDIQINNNKPCHKDVEHGPAMKDPLDYPSEPSLFIKKLATKFPLQIKQETPLTRSFQSIKNNYNAKITTKTQI